MAKQVILTLVFMSTEPTVISVINWLQKMFNKKSKSDLQISENFFLELTLLPRLIKLKYKGEKCNRIRNNCNDSDHLIF